MKYGDFLVEQMFSHSEKVDAIERYISKNGKKSFHTDDIQFIESHEAHDQAEVLDWKVMDKAEYMSTIEANSSFSPEDFDARFGSDAKVLVVLLEQKTPAIPREYHRPNQGPRTNALIYQSRN